MSTVSILGTECIEIYPDPIGSASPELIRRKFITGVFPIFEEKQVGNSGWNYPFSTITKLRFHYKAGNRPIRYFDLELQTVSNQGTWSGGTLDSLQTAQDDVVSWLNGGNIPAYITAFGGNMSRVGDDILHEYEYTGAEELFDVIANDNAALARRLIVSGGGAGGQYFASTNGGGGGGFPVVGTFVPTVSVVDVYVGKGGNTGEKGEDSYIDTVTATGGGKGKDGNSVDSTGGDGGGGSNFDAGTYPGGTGTPGFDGGNSSVGTRGGGGGGASQDGEDSPSNLKGGDGGEGIANDITGASEVYGSGGGGAGATLRGFGGTNAGDGALFSSFGTGPTSAINGFGGGGGGAFGDETLPGKGGHGTVKIRYTNPNPITFFSSSQILSNA